MMKTIALIFFLLSLTGSVFSQNPKVVIKTELGDIKIEVFVREAPISAGNFLTYVDDSLYANSVFYRVVTMQNQPKNDVKIEVIQGGLFSDERTRYFPIEHETTQTTGILHKDGVLSYARAEPGTAGSEIFICIGDQPELDFGGKRNPDGQGFAAFGKVIEGMDIVHKIQQLPEKDQMLIKPVKIFAIERVN